MTRPCSNCSPNGHHSRTCQAWPGAALPTSSSSAGSGGAGGGVRLFGVRLTDGSIMKKSASMGNLSHSYHSPSSSAAASPSPSSPSAAAGGSAAADPGRLPDEYLSDDPNHASCSSNRRAERKKGTPWTAEEHRLFLIGLQKLGKGDWRGIARNFVVSRTPTQVASHAQKYFIRQSNTSRRKRRSSLFDMVPDAVTDFQPVYEEQVMLPPSQLSQETIYANSLPSLDLSLSTEANEPEPMEESSSTEIPVEDFKDQEQETQPQPIADLSESQPGLQPPAVVPMIYPAFVPMEYQFWPQNPASHPEDTAGLGASSSSHHQHQVFKPVPLVPKEPVNVDELVGMSDKLKLGEAQPSQLNPPQLSLNLLGAPSRQSAFHVSAPVNGSELK